jgi:GNAT superfamily N-acetyltransferase
MIRIDRASADDIPQLAALLNLLFTQESEFQTNPSKQESGLRLIIEFPDVGVLFAARDGDQIVGMVSLLFTISTAQGGPVCWLEDMVICPDRRGDGLGSHLLQHAIGYARSRGFTRITLLTDKLNHRAIRFYEKHAFEQSAMTAMRLYLS